MANQWTGPIDLTGQRFGRLTAISINSDPPRTWNCVCDCGERAKVQVGHLRAGHTTSCGCFHAEVFGNITRKHGNAWPITPEYRAWKNMRTRQRTRGFKAPKQWRTFETFLADVGPRPSPMHRLTPDGWQ
jgi:hypothetical protein